MTRTIALGVVLAALGCSSDGTIAGPADTGAGGAATGSGNGSGGGGLFNPSGSGGSGASGSGGNGCVNELVGVIRDFNDSHPDFEGTLGTDKGIVEEDLGSDDKPVYAGSPTTPTTNGQEAFDQWYRDVDGINMRLEHTIPLTEGDGGVFTFDSNSFFPIDDQGFGNQEREHNFHFTYEIHATFTYEGGEVFTFTGDDDLFTFINGRLAIDLGGVHGAQSATIDLDAQATELGITVGETYSLAFFFAERHTSQSNFRIDTSIGCFSEVPIPD